ncbi:MULTISPECIES: LuxR C-terminal-related transcriptional regulator [unclassified Streptomyces]|uniref:LuxR C-terminal-related transcriptional regulator n=1 Tax=Streptomyces sp. NPDC055082 TaxID=3365718 RepID=UPI0037CFCD79
MRESALDSLIDGIREVVRKVSDREREVLAHVVRGATQGEITRRMDVRPHTVDTCICRTRAKAGAPNRTRLLLPALSVEGPLATEASRPDSGPTGSRSGRTRDRVPSRCRGRRMTREHVTVGTGVPAAESSLRPQRCSGGSSPLFRSVSGRRGALHTLFIPHRPDLR